MTSKTKGLYSLQSRKDEENSDSVSTTTRVTAQEITNTKPEGRQDAPLADHRLLNWERWLENRKQQHNFLGPLLDRTKASLCMNSIEDTRTINERKQVLEAVNIQREPDGGPNFWKLQEPLSNHGCPELPVPLLQLTQADRGLVPPMTYVGVPTYVKKEKEVFGPRDHLTPLVKWDTNYHLMVKQKEIKEQLSELEPHVPQTKNLIVLGRNISMYSETSYKKASLVLSVSHAKEHSDTDKIRSSSYSQEYLCNDERYVCLQIEDMKLNWVPEDTSSENVAETSPTASEAELNKEEDCKYNFKLIFPTTANKMSTKYIRLENHCGVKIAFSWKINSDGFNLIGVQKRSCFFFNKNDDIILPGQVLFIPFFFLSQSIGIQEETWVLETAPKLLVDGAPIKLLLWARVAEAILDLDDFRGLEKLQRPKAIEKYIEGRVLNSIIEEAYDKVMDNVCPSKMLPKFPCDDQMHWYVNPNKNYDDELVDRVREIYSQEKYGTPPDVFNVEAQHRTEHKQLLKHQIVYDLLGNLADKIDLEAKSLQLQVGIRLAPELSPGILMEKPSRSSKLFTKPGKRPVTDSQQYRSDIQVHSIRSKNRLNSGEFSKVSSLLTASSFTFETSESILRFPSVKVRYQDTLYTKVYTLLGETVEQISLVLDELNTPVECEMELVHGRFAKEPIPEEIDEKDCMAPIERKVDTKASDGKKGKKKNDKKSKDKGKEKGKKGKKK